MALSRPSTRLRLPGVFLGCAAAAALWAAPGETATASTAFLVTLAVQASCTVSSTPLSFGAYSGTLIDSTATVTATCTNTTAYNILINGGLSSGGTYQWNLAGPNAALLAYRVYRDAGRTAYWGGTAGFDGVAGTGTGTAQSVTLYGRIPTKQYAVPGSYADTITVTLAY